MRLRDIDPDIIEGGCALGFVYDLLEQVEGIEDLYSRVRTDASYRTYSSEIRQYLRQYLIATILVSIHAPWEGCDSVVQSCVL